TLFDRYRLGVDAEHARSFTRGRTNASGEFREIVRCVESLDGLAPAAAIDEIVPVGNDVAQRTPLVAEGNATVHASGGLDLQLILGEILVDLLPVVDAFLHRTPIGRDALKFDKTLRITHESKNSQCPACIFAEVSAAAASRTLRYSSGMIFLNLSR